MIFTDWIHRFALDTLTSQDLARLHAAFEAGQDHEREACAKLLENGSFFHDQSPAKLLADEAAKAIRARGNT
jgi:hypothetical protein